MPALEQQATVNHSDYSDDGAEALSNASTWCIDESDVNKERVLGQGKFGKVFAGTLNGRKVAVKVLFAGALVDEDGDLVNPNASEDFLKECAALRRVNSPYLITFVGFGTTAEGSGFIVTELLAGGSLEDVLHDPERKLPWPTRIKIGLQVAFGMEHLHRRHMLHRDLKADNCFVDSAMRVKVADFGTGYIAAKMHKDL